MADEQWSGRRVSARPPRRLRDRRALQIPYPPTDGVYGMRETLSLSAVRRLVDKRGAMRTREVLEIAARADLAPINADHIRAAEALLCDPDYAGHLTPERITVGVAGHHGETDRRDEGARLREAHAGLGRPRGGALPGTCGADAEAPGQG